MKNERHRIKTPASIRLAPDRPKAGFPRPLSLTQMPSSFGDGLDDDTVDAWSEALRPRRHLPG